MLLTRLIMKSNHFRCPLTRFKKDLTYFNGEKPELEDLEEDLRSKPSGGRSEDLSRTGHCVGVELFSMEAAVCAPSKSSCSILDKEKGAEEQSEIDESVSGGTHRSVEAQRGRTAPSRRRRSGFELIGDVKRLCRSETMEEEESPSGSSASCLTCMAPSK